MTLRRESLGRSPVRAIVPASVLRECRTNALVDMHTVVSSNVAAIGYDEPNRQLVAAFKSGTAYSYYPVTTTQYAELSAAPSVGKWLQANVVGNPKYACWKLPDSALLYD